MILEGQVAEESIRANKTIENTEETEQRRKLAAEAVTPEYTYQKIWQMTRTIGSSNYSN